MDCLCTGCFYNIQDSVHFKIRLICGWWSNPVCHVCLFDKHRPSISIRVDSNCLNAHTFACFDDSPCYLTSISDKYFVKSLRMVGGEAPPHDRISKHCNLLLLTAGLEKRIIGRIEAELNLMRVYV